MSNIIALRFVALRSAKDTHSKEFKNKFFEPIYLNATTQALLGGAKTFRLAFGGIRMPSASRLMTTHIYRRCSPRRFF